MYHQIDEPDSRSSLKVAPKSFQRQVDWLERRAFRFLSLDEVIDQKGLTSVWDRVVALSFDDGFRDNYEHAFPRLLRQKRSAALFIVVEWVGRNGFLNWSEIRELSENGVIIGSHSLTHRWLPHIKDQDELKREIFDSKKQIEDKIGKPVSHFCYPVGGVDAEVSDLVAEAGYRAAWVAGGRSRNPIRNSILCLRRIKVGPSDSNLFRFAVKAWGVKGVFR